MLKQRVVHASILLMVVAALLLVPATAEAKKNSNTGKKKPQQQTKKNDKKPNPPARKVDPAIQREISADESLVAKDQAALNNISDQLRAKFDTSPDVATANANLKAAIAAYDAEYQTVVKTLLAKPDYAKALADKQAAQQKIDDLRKTDGASSEAISAAATESLVAGKRITDTESDALATDAKAVSLKSALNAASDKVAAIKAQFNDSLKQDPQWSAAKQTLDGDQAKLEQARSKLPT